MFPAKAGASRPFVGKGVGEEFLVADGRHDGAGVATNAGFNVDTTGASFNGVASGAGVNIDSTGTAFNSDAYGAAFNNGVTGPVFISHVTGATNDFGDDTAAAVTAAAAGTATDTVVTAAPATDTAAVLAATATDTAVVAAATTTDTAASIISTDTIARSRLPHENLSVPMTMPSQSQDAASILQFYYSDPSGSMPRAHSPLNESAEDATSNNANTIDVGAAAHHAYAMHQYQHDQAVPSAAASYGYYGYSTDAVAQYYGHSAHAAAQYSGQSPDAVAQYYAQVSALPVSEGTGASVANPYASPEWQVNIRSST